MHHLLDTCEFFTQESSNPNVAASNHSNYKSHTTVNFLGACDPIGCVWDGTIPDGDPGRKSDVVCTKDSKILRQIFFGHTGKADKGFIVDNEAAEEGVLIDRPQKRLRKQIQQSAADTCQTQKIGNTRILIENVNGEVKLDLRYLNVLIPCTHFDVISKVVRVGYLLQNFKRPIIQNNDLKSIFGKANEDSNSDEEDPVAPGRPSRAEVRWFGGTDDGLRDVRDNVRLWGLKCEIERHAELSKMECHKDKSVVEISEIVLAERWDLKMRRQLYEDVRKLEYDGGDL